MSSKLYDKFAKINRIAQVIYESEQEIANEVEAKKTRSHPETPVSIDIFYKYRHTGSYKYTGKASENIICVNKQILYANS